MEYLLKDVAQIQAGNTAPEKSLFSDSGIPFIRAGSLEFLVRGESIEKCEKVDAAIAKEKSLKLYPKNSIIFAKSGMSAKMGRVYTLPIDAYVVSHLAIITTNENIANPIFIKHYFSYNPPFHLIKDEAYPSINLKDIGNIELFLPNLETQEKIVAVLEKAQGLIEKRAKAIDCLDVLIKSFFGDMFGSPVLNEKKWNKSPLKEFGSIITGNTPPRSNSEFYDSKFIEWIKTNNIIADDLHMTTSEEYLSEAGCKVGRHVDRNALLVTCIAGSISSIGRSAISDRRVAFNQQINAIVPFKGISVYFLYWMFKVSNNYIQTFATNGMKKLITKGEFEKILFIKPDYNLQLQFESIALKQNAFFQKLLISKNQIEKLQKALSQLAFTGKLTFNTAVDLEFLMENDYQFFRDNSSSKAIQLLLDRLDKSELNKNAFSEKEEYNKARLFAFELLKEGKIKQTFDENSQKLKLILT